MIPSLVEIALRALLVAVAVWAGLRLLGVRDVLAQKAAWGLVLVAAILMPLLLPLAMRWQVAPSSMTLALPAHLGRRVVDALKVALNDSPKPLAADAISVSAPRMEMKPVTTAPVETREFTLSAAAKIPVPRVAPSTAASGSSGSRSTIEIAPPMERVHEPTAAAPRPLLPTLETLAITIYMAICGVFLLRLLYGLTTAIGLWLDAEPIDVANDAADFGGAAAGMRLRSSRAVASPVTIGSGVVLPASYDEWDAEKLRVVLAHERSHVRQGDFYLQLAAGVYSALFWFSPLGWWLKSKLSDLGEALSDRAGLEQAGSRSSYAQLLLEFAAQPHPTVIGVAMARSSSLSHRIERLLDDSRFRQSFSVSPRRALAAALLVPAAIFGATALIRVEAAGGQVGAEQPRVGLAVLAQAASLAPVTPLAPVAPLAPVTPLAPAAISAQSQPGRAYDSYAPIAPAAMAMPPVPPRASFAPLAAFAPMMAPQAPGPAIAPPAPPVEENQNLIVGRGETLTIINQAKANARLARRFVRSGSGNGYAYLLRSGDEDSYALVTNPAGGVRWSGDWHDERRMQLEKASKVANGAKFLWFEHDDKSYVIDDAGIISSIEAMYKPMDELGRKQQELGKQQEELGKQQEELGRKQEQASVPAPDVSKEIAELNAAVAKLQSKKGGTLTQEDLGDLQSKIGDLQGKIGDVEGKIGEEQGRLGDEQGKLGEQQGKLGEEQGRLGEQEGRLAEEADRKVREIIEQSLKDGKAKLVE
jgi:beta-lactamase regulating signal transducer with metallopeptidase domain